MVKKFQVAGNNTQLNEPTVKPCDNYIQEVAYSRTPYSGDDQS